MQNFNFHSHTYRCGHAQLDMTDEEYVQEYIQMGIKKFAFTDHCPEKNKIDKRTNMRMDYSQKDEYLSSIKALKEKYKDKIEIESGYEVEYLPGEEENIRELKEETDKIVLGQHFIYDNDKKLKIFGEYDITDEEIIRYAEYLERAMELGIPDIIAHPDIFLHRRINFGKTEEKVTNMICEAAEKYNIPLEINLAQIFNRVHDERLKDLTLEERIKRVPYPRREFWKIVANYNIRVLYGIDAHCRGQVLEFNNSVKLANQIIGEETINKLNFIEEWGK